MALRVLLTRPEPESRALAAALGHRGIETIVAPVLAIRPTGARLADAGRYVAALDTSGHGVDGLRSAEHTSELQSLTRKAYAVCCLTKTTDNYEDFQQSVY